MLHYSTLSSPTSPKFAAMNIRSPFAFRSFVRSLTVATLGLVTLLTAPAAKALIIVGGGSSSVSYNIPLQIAQGVVPFSYGYTLQITTPTTITASILSPLLVTLTPSVVSAPAGVSNAQALSYLTLTTTTLNVTAAGQTLSVGVSLNIPAGVAGAYSYEIQTSLPSLLPLLGIVDNGAFINVTTTSPNSSPALPIIEITQPVDQSVINWNFSNGPLVIPYTIVGSTTDGSNLTGMTASMNGADLGITPTGIGTANATATGNYTVTGQGTYTITAIDTDASGSATTTSTVTVNAIGTPPTVVINTPAPNTSYTLTGTEVDVPFTFTGTSQLSGITQLTATLDGTPVTITSNGIGDLIAVGNGTLAFTSAGDHELVVTASNSYGTATTTETLTVVAQTILIPPTVVINTPANGSTFSVVQGGNLSVPFTFTGSTTGDGITNLTATLDGTPVTFTSTGLTTQTAVGTTNLTFTTAGNHTLAVTATNDGGVASAVSDFIINVQPSHLTVAINKPVANSTYAITTNGGSVTIPDSFTGTSTAPSGVTSLSVTLNGTAVTVTPSAFGQPTVTATGNLVISTPGTYTIAVTDTDQNGVATTQENITVTGPSQPACLKIAITKPCNGASFALGSSKCPLYVPVDLTANTSVGTTLSTLTLTLNGKAVTLTTVKGIGKSSGSGSVNLPITSAGTYTLVATTTSGSSSATATTTFTVNANSNNNGGCNQGDKYNNWGGSSNSGSGWNSGNSGWGWGGYGSGSCYNVTQYTCNPPPCNVNWQQSWSCSSTQKGGSSLPLCFQVQYTGSNCANYWNNYFSKCSDDYEGCDKSARSCWGSSGFTNCLFGNVQSDWQCLNGNWDEKSGKEVSCDNTVKVCVYEVYATGKCGTPTTYTCKSSNWGWNNWGSSSNSATTCQINNSDQYTCNFTPATGTHTYRCDVYYTDQNSGNDCFLGSQQFCTK